MLKKNYKNVLILGLVMLICFFVGDIFMNESTITHKLTNGFTKRVSNDIENEDLPIKIDLSFTNGEMTDDKKSSTYDIPDQTQTVTMVLSIAYSSTGYDGMQDIKAGRLRIEIPVNAFESRDKDKQYPMTNKTAFLDSIKTNDMLEILDDGRTSDVIVLTNKDLSSAQLAISLSYDVTALTVEDNSTQDFGIKITDTATGKDISPDNIKATFITHVNSISVSKTIYNDFAPNGSYYAWDKSLYDKFQMTEEEFNLLQKDYYLMTFAISTNVRDVNQKSTIYVKETPGQGGEAIAVTYRDITNGFGVRFYPFSKETDGQYAGQWKYDEWKGASSLYFLVLVKYPKNGNYTSGEDRTTGVVGPQMENRADVTLVGVDNNGAKKTSDYDTAKFVWMNANATIKGDIWGVDKSEASGDAIGGIELLKKGQDVTFSYNITGIGKVYKYDVLSNGTNKDGPYKMEVVDDAMYVDGLGTDGSGIKRLGSSDFHFQTFTMKVKHVDVLKSDLNLKIIEEEAVPLDEREPVEVWVMTDTSGDKWIHDQTLKNIPFYNQPGNASNIEYADENNNTIFELKHDNVYRVKFVYKGVTGDVKLESTLTGVLKADGEVVKEVLKNIETNNIKNFQLFNWDGMMAYDNKGNWLNSTDESHIKDPTPAAMKSDLLEFDTKMYPGHSNGEYTNRKNAQNNLIDANFFSGAAKKPKSGSSAIKAEDGKIKGSYLIATITGAGASNERDFRKLVETGIIKESKEIVFYELLPLGMRISDIKPWERSEMFDSGQYTWDSFTRYAGMLDPINREIPKISYTIEDNYKGTRRQMVKITVKYKELPVVKLGYDEEIVYALGSVLQIDTEAEPYELSSYMLDNHMAAQFNDDKGKPIELDGSAVSRDDGSVFGNLKDRDGNNAFKDLDEDKDITKKTVVGASQSDVYTQYITGTELKKKIKADDFDDEFKDYTQTYAGHNYTYRLTFFSNSGTTKNVVIYDSIEQAYGNNPYWKGTLYGVDLQEAKDAGFNDIQVYVNTTKYYTMSEMVSNSSTGDQGLTPEKLIESNGWTLIDPDKYTDWKDVKTIAFSFGKNTEFGEHSIVPMSVNVYLKMTAPDTIHKEQTAEKQILAYNAPAYYSEKLSSNVTEWVKDTTAANTVTIGLKSATLDLPAITKNYIGHSLPKFFEDEFEITPINDTPDPKEYKNGVWGDIINSIKVKVNAESNTGVSDYSGSVYFTEPGIYTYEITEKVGDKIGVEYSQAKYKVVFTAEDVRKDIRYDDDTIFNVDMKIYQTHDDEGNELVEAIEVSDIEFTNSYIFVPPLTLDSIIKYVLIAGISIILLILSINMFARYTKKA